MITFLQGPSHRANTAAIFAALQEKVEAEQRAILLVPEHLSHEMERQLCVLCGNSACRWAEVLSFSQLADRVFRALGDAELSAIDQGGRVLLMYRAVQDLQSRLNHFHPGRIKMEFLLQLLDLASEFHRSAITPVLLQQASKQVDGYLSEKLSELSLILQQYDAISAAEGLDPSQRLTRLAAVLPDTDFFSHTSLYLDGFSCFSEQEQAVVEQLCQYASDLTLTLPMGSDEEGLFAPASRTRRALIGFLVKKDIPHCVRDIASEPQTALTYLRDHLMQTGPSEYLEDASSIELFQAPDLYAECLEAASWVARQVRDGHRYGEIQIACAELSQYQQILEAVFARFSIPFAMAQTEPAVNRPLAALLRAVLDCAAFQMEREDVVRYLKSGYAPICTDWCDRLENYALMWNLNGRQWCSPWHLHPDGYGVAFDADADSRLALLNRARQAAITPLEQLCTALRQSKSCSQMVHALYQFCETIQVPAHLQEAVNAMTPRSRQAAMEDAQLYDVFLSALEQMDAVLGEQSMPVEQFATLVQLVLAQYRVGAIPPAVDCVSVGAIHMMRQKSPQCLLVLGAQEGQFPHYQGSDGILSDQERERLHEQGLTAFRCHADDTAEELLAIYNLVAAPTQRLAVSCVLAGTGPSYLFQRISQLFPTVSVQQSPEIPTIWYTKPQTAGMLLEMAQTQPAYQAVGQVIRSLGLKVVTEAAAKYHAARTVVTSLSTEAVQQLYGKNLYLSASRIDQYASCRCAFFYRYGLKAKPRRPAKYDAPLYGTFVHAVLEETVQEVMKRGGFGAVNAQQASDLTSQAIEHFFQSHPEDLAAQPARTAYLFSRNLEEVRAVAQELWQELNGSRFVPVQCELEFSEQGKMPSVIIHGEGCDGTISGFVDRVDVYWKDGVPYVRVVDYKTGPKAFDYTDVLEGIGLQMLLYLFALEDYGEVLFGQKPEPAGVLYVPARVTPIPSTQRPTPEEAERARSSTVQRSGLISADETLIDAMEQYTLQPRYLPITVRNSAKYLATQQQLQALKDYVQQTLVQMVNTISQGDVTPNPYQRDAQHGACNYCDYAAACHFDASGQTMRKLKRTSQEQFWQQVEKGRDNHG